MYLSMKMFFKKESHFKISAASMKDVSTIFRFHDPMSPLVHACPLSADTPSTCLCRYNYLKFPKHWTYSTDPSCTCFHTQTPKHMHMSVCILIQLYHSVKEIKSVAVQY